MRIAIGSDHAAWETKTEVVAELRRHGHWIDDLGTYDGERTDYPRYAYAVARQVAAGDAERGILLCGSGIGMSMAANRVPGVRAALVHDEQTAKLCREHNDANVICLGARLLALDEIINCIELFLDEPFAEGRHTARVAMIDDPPPS